jgi:NNP family nitrate/nitrite transporter-like MFS transporter
MTDAPSPRESQVFLLFFLAGMFFVNFVCRIIAAPLMPVIEKDLSFSHSGAGLFFMMVALGYSAGLVVSGLVSSRITHRGAISLATVATGCSLIMIALSHQIWMIRLGLFSIGVFTGLYLPSAITTITSSITAANWGKAFAVHELAPGLAFILAPLLAEGLLLLMTWRVILELIGIAAIVMGFAYGSLSAAGNFNGEAPTFVNIRLITGNRDFWIMVVLFCAAIAGSVGIYSMMPLYLTAERGIDRGTANTLLGLSRISAIPVVFFAGWIVDRFGAKPTIAAVILFNGFTMILLGLLPGRWVILTVFLQPVLSGAFFPAGFAALSRIVHVKARSLSVSITIFIANLVGSGLVPVMLGALGDAGNFAVAFILTGSVVMLTIFLIIRLELKEGQPSAMTSD